MLVAGNVLIFQTPPLISSANLLDIILSCFGQLSGLHVNPQKSTALNVSVPTSLSKILPFPWATSHITYLGVKFTARPSDLFSDNYPPMLTHLSTHVQMDCTSLGLDRQNIDSENVHPPKKSLSCTTNTCPVIFSANYTTQNPPILYGEKSNLD